MGAEEERNKELARRLIDALTNADQAAVEELYADDFELWTAGSLPFSGRKTRAQSIEGFPQVLGAFPKGLTFEVVAMTAEGERVAIEAVSRGEHVTGGPYANEYHFLMRARDGKVVEFKEYMDTDQARTVFFGGE